MTAVVICQGPTGVGYYCEVADLPSQDRGVITDRHGALLVCDAAIVAYLCAQRLPGQVHLVTNNLGSVAPEADLMNTKLGAGITLHPDPSPFKGAPLDMVFIDRARGARSYVTTNYYPSASHLLRTTSGLYESVARECHTVLYVDIEARSDSGRAALEAAADLAVSGTSVWNLGQVTHLSEVEDWLRGRTLPARAIVQASMGDATASALEVQSTFQRISTAADQALVITLGRTGAAWADHHNAEVIATDPISDAFTLGAGAVFGLLAVLSG